MDTERLTHLAALGDAQAAAGLARLQVRRSEAPIPAGHYIGMIDQALDNRDHDSARRSLFALHLAYPFFVRWYVSDEPRPGPIPLVTERRRQGPRGDHFLCAEDLKSLRFAAVDIGAGSLVVPLLWSQSLLNMARRALVHFACYHARRLARSEAFRDYCAGAPAEVGRGCQALAPFFDAPPDPIAIAAKGDPDDMLLKIRMTARALGDRYGRAFYAHPNLTPPGVFRCALETFDPDASLSRIRASATAVCMYTSHIIDGPGEVAADSKRLHARMLAAIYCGCEYRITPED